jgi:hypothetical protein
MHFGYHAGKVVDSLKANAERRLGALDSLSLLFTSSIVQKRDLSLCDFARL